MLQYYPKNNCSSSSLLSTLPFSHPSHGDWCAGNPAIVYKWSAGCQSAKMWDVSSPNTLLWCPERCSNHTFPGHHFLVEVLPCFRCVIVASEAAFLFPLCWWLRWILLVDRTVHQLCLHYSEGHSLLRFCQTIHPHFFCGTVNRLDFSAVYPVLDVMKKKFALVCFIFLLLDILPFLIRSWVLMLSWYSPMHFTWYPCVQIKWSDHNILGMNMTDVISSVSKEPWVFIFNILG